MSRYALCLNRTALLLVVSPVSTVTWAAAEAESSSAGWVWNLLIALIVLAFSAASAALPVAAWKQWRGYWRGAALFPLCVLLLWIMLIIVARIVNPGSHALWPLEIFAWSMLNMIYMVAAITSKRILEKGDQQQQDQSKNDIP